MTLQIYETLIKENISKKDRIYRSSLNEQKKMLNIDIYDTINPPKKYQYHNKRLTLNRLEEIAEETFTGIDFVCDICVDSGVQISFKPKNSDYMSQKYFGHHICIGENSALMIRLQMGKDSKILPAIQREQYKRFINTVMNEYLSNGKDMKKYVRQKLEPALLDNIQQFAS
jgi:hypothetical protein